MALFGLWSRNKHNPDHFRTKRKVDHYKSEILRWVTMPYHVTVMFFASLGSLLAAWWNKRNLRYLLQGIPSLLVFIGIIVLASFCFFQDRNLLAKTYQMQAMKSLRESDQYRVANRYPDARDQLSLAQTCYARLTLLQPDSPDNRYSLALAYQQNALLTAAMAKPLLDELKNAKTDDEKKEIQKKIDRKRDEIQSMDAATMRLMNGLAPPDKKGFGKAHIWLVNRIYRMERGPDGRIIPPSPATIVEAERHLLHALEWPDADVRINAHFCLARLYRDTNRIDDAKLHLTEVAARFPEYRLVLAQWSKDSGESDRVLANAKGAENAFRGRLTTNGEDHEARFGLIECLMLQARYADAREQVNLGATLANSPDLIRQYARQLSRVLIAWADAKEKDPKSTAEERLDFFESALKVDPDNPELMSRLLKMTKEKTVQAQKARELMHGLVVAEKGSFLASLFLGIDAYQEGNAAEARMHWEKAFQLSKGAPIVANNLAWILAFEPPYDLNRALQLINAAIEQMPNEAKFRGTRGHILAKMDRPKDALPDLQESVKVYPNDQRLFRTLADVCDKLGYKTIAKDYRKHADEVALKTGQSLNSGEPIRPKTDTGETELKPPPAVPSGDSKGEQPKDGSKPGSKPPG